jgi:murein DD-endopeptidase MepM/ murein hydrolase activator NlpD
MKRAFLALLLIVAAVGFAYVLSVARDTSTSAEAPPATLRFEEGSRGRLQEPSVPPPPEVPVEKAPETSDIPAVVPEPVVPPAPPSKALEERGIAAPLAGLKRSDIVDTFDHPRAGGERRHEAVDIMAPRGTPVLAVTSGPIVKLFESEAGGLTIYQFDANERHCYYYAHLDGYAEGLREGMLVKQGAVIGYVGSSGNADPGAPHLHFAVYELGPEKLWYSSTNTPVNPFPLLIDAIRR